MAKGMGKLPDDWHTFFKDHLDRVYCIASHLTERLPELAGQDEFTGLQHLFGTEIREAEQQVYSLEAIYHYLQFIPGFEQCTALVQLIESAFSLIRNDHISNELRELSLIFYLQNLQSLLHHSFELLEYAASRASDTRLIAMLTACKPVKAPALLCLLKDNYNLPD